MGLVLVMICNYRWYPTQFMILIVVNRLMILAFSKIHQSQVSTYVPSNWFSHKLRIKTSSLSYWDAVITVILRCCHHCHTEMLSSLSYWDAVITDPSYWDAEWQITQSQSYTVFCSLVQALYNISVLLVIWYFEKNWTVLLFWWWLGNQNNCLMGRLFSGQASFMASTTSDIFRITLLSCWPVRD